MTLVKHSLKIIALGSLLCSLQVSAACAPVPAGICGNDSIDTHTVIHHFIPRHCVGNTDAARLFACGHNNDSMFNVHYCSNNVDDPVIVAQTRLNMQNMCQIIVNAANCQQVINADGSRTIEGTATPPPPPHIPPLPAPPAGWNSNGVGNACTQSNKVRMIVDAGGAHIRSMFPVQQ